MRLWLTSRGGVEVVKQISLDVVYNFIWHIGIGLIGMIADCFEGEGFWYV
jgi:hypothetical protein